MSKTKPKFPVIRSVYQPYDSADFATTITDASITEQAHIDLHCPIRLTSLGTLDPNAECPAPSEAFRDFSSVLDFRESIERVKASNDAFASLPVKVRSFFENDSASYVEFMLDSDNLEKAIELGIAIAPPVDDVPDPTPPPEDPEKSPIKGSPAEG